MGSDEKKNMFSLPGSMPPEKEVFACEHVLEQIQSEMSVDFRKIMIQQPDMNHHKFVEEVSKKSQLDEAHVQVCVVKWFLDAQSPDWGKDLMQKIVAIL